MKFLALLALCSACSTYQPVYLQDGRWQEVNTKKQELCVLLTIEKMKDYIFVDRPEAKAVMEDMYVQCLHDNEIMI